MEEESFIDAFGDVPTDLAGDYSQLYIFRAEDFGAWYRRVRDAHEREVDALRDSMAEPDWDDQAALDHLTDAQLADHGLCRIGSAAMWDELRDIKDRELSEEHGLVRLPVDADGVPIRVGDKVTEHEDGHTFKVDGFMDWDGEWWVFMRDGIQAPASRCTHYHAPTVEDVLREFTDEVWNRCCEGATASDSGIDELVAECAAKLRLAGGE